MSCPSAGNCAVGGIYVDLYHNPHGFLANEVNGTWRNAIELPGIAALSPALGSSYVNSVSCPSAGHCVAGGSYQDSSWNFQGFLVSEH